MTTHPKAVDRMNSDGYASHQNYTIHAVIIFTFDLEMNRKQPASKMP